MICRQISKMRSHVFNRKRSIAISTGYDDFMCDHRCRNFFFFLFIQQSFHLTSSQKDVDSSIVLAVCLPLAEVLPALVASGTFCTRSSTSGSAAGVGSLPDSSESSLEITEYVVASAAL